MAEKIKSLEELVKWVETAPSDEVNRYLKDAIANKLEVDSYEISHILDDAKTPCQNFIIYMYLQTHMTLHSENLSTYGRQRSDIETKITNAKKRIIEDLKFLYKESSLPYDGLLIGKLTHEMRDIKLDYEGYKRSHKEPILKIYKDDLYSDLVESCNTGKRRARELTKILNFL